jgi:hypothetical protein
VGAKRYRFALPSRSIVYRKKTGFPLPLADYLAPLAQEKFFHNGFCVEFLGMRRQGIMEAISAWKENVHKFFNLLVLEVWGCLFFLGETEEALTEAVFTLRQELTGRVTEVLVGEAHRDTLAQQTLPCPPCDEAPCSRAALPHSGNASGAGTAEPAVILLPKLAGRALSVG